MKVLTEKAKVIVAEKSQAITALKLEKKKLVTLAKELEAAHTLIKVLES